MAPVRRAVVQALVLLALPWAILFDLSWMNWYGWLCDVCQELFELFSSKRPVSIRRILVHRYLSRLRPRANGPLGHAQNLSRFSYLHVLAQFRFHL